MLNRYAIEVFRSHVVLKATSTDHAIVCAQRLFHSTTGPLAANQIKVKMLNVNPASSEATNPEVMSKKKTTPKAEKARIEKLIAKKAEKAVAKKKPTPPAEKATKAMSGLDAAAKVLQEQGTEMTAKEIVDLITSKGLAAGLKGKTPHATIYAAIITEISKKGAASRFKRGSAKGTFLRPVIVCNHEQVANA